MHFQRIALDQVWMTIRAECDGAIGTSTRGAYLGLCGHKTLFAEATFLDGDLAQAILLVEWHLSFIASISSDQGGSHRRFLNLITNYFRIGIGSRG